MGILLVAGLVLLGYGFYSNVRQLSAKDAPQETIPPERITQFGAVQVPIPPGARVVDMTSAGGRVVLRLEDGEGTRLLVFDPLAGAVAGSFLLVPSPIAAE